MTPHGSNSTYCNWGCRCAECVEAHRVQCAIRRTERRTEVADKFDSLTHGSNSTYCNWGCRCAECTKANTDVARKNRQRTKAVKP